MLRARLLPLVLVAVATLSSGCVTDEPTVAVLVADGSDRASRVVDLDVLTDRVDATCDECRVTVYDAEGDAEVQRSQARQAVAESADVLVVVPVDADALTSVSADDLPVVSLGTLVPDSDGFIGMETGDVPDQEGSDLDAAREVVLGQERSMTYVPTVAMSERAGDVAVALLAGTPVPETDQDVDGVDAWFHESQDVTIDTLTTVLVGQGVITLDDLCSGRTEKRCARLGLR